MVYRYFCSQVRQRLVPVILLRRRNFLYAIGRQWAFCSRQVLFFHFQLSVGDAIEDVENWMGENLTYDACGIGAVFLSPGQVRLSMCGPFDKHQANLIKPGQQGSDEKNYRRAGSHFKPHFQPFFQL